VALAVAGPAQAGVRAPRVVAAGGQLTVRLPGVKAPAKLEIRYAGKDWHAVGKRHLRAPKRPQVLRLRARGADGKRTRARRVRVRYLRLSAVGDINLGDGPGAAIAAYGPNYPWSSVGARLRAADIAFGNLECAVSGRGTPEAKTFRFRGRPSSLRAAGRRGGLDIVNLANNHAGDYGDIALLDTLRYARHFGIATVGAGPDAKRAYRPRVMNRLGLKVAFVGFSTILPFDFQAGPGDPGTAWGYPGRVRSSVRRAARKADVVITTFHWGIERDPVENAREQALAKVALDAGATAVIGGHPHVLQPIRRSGRHRLVAYSLGNFVFTGTSAFTRRTGILEMRLARGRIAGHRLRRATIINSRPVL
jgi:poly-gamma-glutamate capsule biosynthesis protein CapA/YwtB (metallophosphatase superfamily)